MTNIKVGDMVKVVDWGKRYSTYTDFFSEHDFSLLGLLNKSRISVKDIASYESCKENFKEKDYIFEVLYIGKHRNEDSMIAFIKAIDKYDNVYTFLVGTEGLALDVPKMTYEEIREKLGYDFELVD